MGLNAFEAGTVDQASVTLMKYASFELFGFPGLCLANPSNFCPFF